MKTLTLLSMLVALSAKADTKILCQFQSTVTFGVVIDAGDFTPAEDGYSYKEKAPAEVSFTGPRVSPYTISATLMKDAIMTRVYVGSSYFIDLGNQNSISLEDITYAPEGFEHGIGFKGVYTSKGQNTKLNCKYGL